LKEFCFGNVEKCKRAENADKNAQNDVIDGASRGTLEKVGVKSGTEKIIKESEKLDLVFYEQGRSRLLSGKVIFGRHVRLLQRIETTFLGTATA